MGRFIAMVDPEQQDPQFTIIENLDNGIRITDTSVVMVEDGVSIGQFTAGGYTDFKGITMDTSRTFSIPAVRFNHGSTDCGIFEYNGLSTSDPFGIGFSRQEAGGWSPTLFADSVTGNVTIFNDLEAGRVEAGIGSFYTSLDVDGYITTWDDAYDADDWNGNLTVPTKNALRDKIETIEGGGGAPTELSEGDRTATTYGITSDGSVNDVILLEADTDVAGLLGADKWDEIVASTTHLTSTGDDHSYIDQAVTAASSPTFVDITVEDVRASSHVEAPLILGSQGTFYTGINIGSFAGEDDHSWRISQTAGLDELFIEPARQVPSGTVTPQVVIDAPLSIWPNQPTIGAGANRVISFGPDITVTGQGVFAFMNLTQTMTHAVSSGIPAGFAVYDQSEWISENTNYTVSTFQLFGAQTNFTTITEGGELIAPAIFAAQPTFLATNVTATIPTKSLFPPVFVFPPRNFWSDANFESSGASGNLTVPLYIGYDSYLRLVSEAGGSVTIDEFIDIRMYDSIVSAGGTEAITERHFIQMWDETSAVTVNGIDSAITAGATKKFINHTGTAVSAFGGAITAPDVLVDDDAYAAGWDANLEVPTKNAVYDKIEALAPALNGGSRWDAMMPPSSPSAFDDEFDGAEDSEPDGGLWTAFDPGSDITSMVIKENPGRLFIKQGQGNEFGGVHQPRVDADGDFTVYTYVGISSRTSRSIANEQFAGLAIFQDVGAPSTSNIILAGLHIDKTSTAADGAVPFRIGMWEFNDYSDASETVTFGENEMSDFTIGGGVFLRLRYNSTNNDFNFDWSRDGISWHEVAQFDIDAGPAMSSFNGIGLLCRSANDSDHAAEFSLFRIDETNAALTNNVIPAGELGFGAAPPALISTPDEITASSEGVAASITTLNTEVTTDGGEDLNDVTLANGTSGQVKHIYCVVEGHANDTWKITPATMCGGTQITFAGVGEGCTLVYADSEGWCVTANNGGTIS
jgi:hypothetical protein